VDWPKMLACGYDPPFKPALHELDRPVNFDVESSVAAMKVEPNPFEACRHEV
jgi:hypothetical protein